MGFLTATATTMTTIDDNSCIMMGWSESWCLRYFESKVLRFRTLLQVLYLTLSIRNLLCTIMNDDTPSRYRHSRRAYVLASVRVLSTIEGDPGLITNEMLLTKYEYNVASVLALLIKEVDQDMFALWILRSTFNYSNGWCASALDDTYIRSLAHHRDGAHVSTARFSAIRCCHKL